MSENYIDVDLRLVELAKRSDEVATEEALELLSILYINNGAISESTRTAVWFYSQFWVWKWVHENHDVKEDADLFDYMRLKSPYYKENQEYAEHYINDFGFLNLRSLHRIAFEMLDETDNEKEKIVIASGFIFWILAHTKEK